MKSWEFEAVVYDGGIYCNDCLPEDVAIDGEEVSPIFADSEVTSTPVCDKCGASHDYMTVLDE